jgi:hypothetical protein
MSEAKPLGIYFTLHAKPFASTNIKMERMNNQ